MKDENKLLKLKLLKENLSEQLRHSLKQCDESVLEELVNHGYSSFEIIQMITNSDQASGLDLINCDEVVRKTLK